MTPTLERIEAENAALAASPTIEPMTLAQEQTFLLDARLERLEGCIDKITSKLLAVLDQDEIEKKSVDILQATTRMVGQLTRSLLTQSQFRGKRVDQSFDRPHFENYRIRKAQKQRLAPGTKPALPDIDDLKQTLNAFSRGDLDGHIMQVLRAQERTLSRTKKNLATSRAAVKGSAAPVIAALAGPDPMTAG